MSDPEEEYKYVEEHIWTAQMIGKDFFFHHDTVHTDYEVNPPELEDFTEAWW